MMHKAKSVNTNGKYRHLKLVTSISNSSVVEPLTTCVSKKPVDLNEINFLTLAMMHRLWIPHTKTIVGLLDVGTTKDNFEELYKWIGAELNLPTNGCASNDLQQLERRFYDVVSCFPEM